MDRIGRYINQSIKHLIRELPSFVLNSVNIPQRLTDLTIPIETVLPELDVESLYASIPHDVGVHAVSQWLDTRHLLAAPQNEFLLELLEAVLNNNYFVFNKKYYSQNREVAMGPRMPHHAHVCIWDSGRGKRSTHTQHLRNTWPYGLDTLTICWWRGGGLKKNVKYSLHILMKIIEISTLLLRWICIKLNFLIY